MIRSLCGEVLSVTETSVILDVGGLGFDILCSRGGLALCSPGGAARLTVYLQISEAGAFLFGFANEAERELFLRIILIKGIGGRTAMTILSVLSADEIVRAVSLADVNAFMRVPGIGKKTAERLCFELKNVLPAELISVLPGGFSAQSAPSGRVSDTVADALRSLGFAQTDAVMALSMVRAALGEDFEKLDEEKLLKAALKELQRK
ncbi:MAG: Holliday junction branch migration protein RuvA [Synergistaceae bacterium]|nr:Holliday junction branch migration protein RuvA [Synergistaceae bacterium]